MTNGRATPSRFAQRVTTWLAADGARRAVVLAILLAPLLCYLPFLAKGFVSEDFLLIQLHRDRSPWSDLVQTFGTPWLQMELFGFYRPIAALLFAAEAIAFGAWSLGYNAVHLALHLLGTWCVFLLLECLLGTSGEARDWRWRLPAALGALFFGLYPVVPNSVLFVASFANVYGTTATIAAALLFVRWRERRPPTAAIRGSKRPLQLLPWSAIATYVVALGCYESAVMLPAWLVLFEATRSERLKTWPGRILALAPFLVITVAYLELRTALFGNALGGYTDMAERIRGFDLSLYRPALRALARLPMPWYTGGGRPGMAEVAGALTVPTLLVLWIATAKGKRARLLRALALGIGWALLAMAPFSFPIVQPASSRYWYLAAAGIALVVATTAERALAASRPPRMAVLAAALLLLAIDTAGLLRHLRWMQRAANTARVVANAIEAADDGAPFFVANYPLFLQDRRGMNLAQVYHYSLRAAVQPPFRTGHSTGRPDVFPLPPTSQADLRRLASEHTVYLWRDASSALERLPVAPEDVPPLLETQGPPDGGVVVPEDPATLRVRVEIPAGDTARVVTVARGNYSVVRVPGPAHQVVLPGAVLRFWEQLSGGEQYWWVELLARDGRVLATSRAHSLRVAPAAP